MMMVSSTRMVLTCSQITGSARINQTPDHLCLLMVMTIMVMASMVMMLMMVMVKLVSMCICVFVIMFVYCLFVLCFNLGVQPSGL